LKNNLPKIGSKNGKWILVRRENLGNGKVRDTWILDPTVIITPTIAYKGVGNNVTSHPGNPSGATTEFTSTEYSNIASDDGVYASHSASANTTGRYCWVAHRFTFDLTQYNTGGKRVTGLTYKWDGYRSGGYLAYHSYHKETTGWVQDVEIPTSDGAGFEITKTIANVSASIINNTFEFGVYVADQFVGETVTVYIYTDYVELEVTYEIDILDVGVGEDQFTAGEVKIISDEGVGEDQLSISTLSYITISDEGVGQDQFSATAAITISDEGVGEDQFTLPYKMQTFEDEGSGYDEFTHADITLYATIQKLLSFIMDMTPLMLVMGALTGLIKATKPKLKAKVEKKPPPKAPPAKPPKPAKKSEIEKAIEKAAKIKR
jgi:hypothetical protein